jgi:hypothetical protein
MNGAVHLRGIIVTAFGPISPDTALDAFLAFLHDLLGDEAVDDFLPQQD